MHVQFRCGCSGKLPGGVLVDGPGVYAQARGEFTGVAERFADPTSSVLGQSSTRGVVRFMCVAGGRVCAFNSAAAVPEWVCTLDSAVAVPGSFTFRTVPKVAS